MDVSMRDRFIQFNHDLSKLDIREISPEVLAAFDELVFFCTANESHSAELDAMLDNDDEMIATCGSLCRLFALYGLHTEMKVARLCAADSGAKFGEHYKYRQNYEELVQFEVSVLRELGVQLVGSTASSDAADVVVVSKMAFVGSGPIPMSSMCILNDHAPAVQIYNIDMLDEANQLAATICEKVLPAPLSEQMHFITQDICEQPLPAGVQSILDQCQLIYLAAYVGMSEAEKLRVLENLVRRSTDDGRKVSKQFFVVRTANGIYQVLFPRIRTEPIGNLHDGIDNKPLFRVERAQNAKNTYGVFSIFLSTA